MKRFLNFFRLLLVFSVCGGVAFAQNTNPQTSFANQIAISNPSSYVTFSNLASPFLETVSNTNFTAGYSANYGGLNGTFAGTMSSGSVWCNATPGIAGPVTSISLPFFNAPSAGTLTAYIATPTGASYVLNSSFTLTVTATAGVQVLVPGTGYTAFSLTAGQTLCTLGATAPAVSYSTVVGTNYLYKFTGTTPTLGTATTFTLDTAHSPGIAWTQGTSAILTGQTGFDPNLPGNYSASFPYNGYIYAPNNTIGDHEWSQPWGLMIQIDNLQWARSGTQVLWSKGNVGITNEAFVEVYLNMTGTAAQVCVKRNGAYGGGGLVSDTDCSNSATYDLPNGYHYNIFVVDTGTGQANPLPGTPSYGNPASLQIYVNGNTGVTASYGNTGRSFGSWTATASGGTSYTAGEQFGVAAGSGGANCNGYYTIATVTSGAISTITAANYASIYGCTSTPTLQLYPYLTTLSGTGSGYAATTYFTSSGGGTGCVMSGSMTSSGGVPASVTTLYNSTACTSPPTLTLTNPTGTGETLVATPQTGSGATLTATLGLATLSTATTAPMYISGAWSAPLTTATWNANTSFGGNTATPAYSMNIDKVATFSSAPSLVQINSTFYQTNWYKQILPALAVCTNPAPVILSDDGGDPDNQYVLATAIRLHQDCRFNIQGIEQTDGAGTCQALWRQMLDQAGLNHIPVTVPPTFAQSACGSFSSNIALYNGTTSTTASSYPSSTAMYRRVLANNPTTPVTIFLVGAWTGYSAFLQSGADSISSLTGLQLQAQNQSNGGKILAQGMCKPSPTCTSTSDNTLIDATAGAYVLSHMGSPALPIYWYADIPQTAGGVLYTRTAYDPFYLYAVFSSANSRQAFDSLPVAGFFTNLFVGSVGVTVSGGTGYANTTYFTSSGGGTGCTVTGNFPSSGGVPTGVINFDSTLGGPQTTFPYGGYGCLGTVPTIVPTTPTGTGATFTVTNNNPPCFTASISGSTLSGTTASCNNQYLYQLNAFADSGYAPILQWFLNSTLQPPPNPTPKSQ